MPEMFPEYRMPPGKRDKGTILASLTLPSGNFKAGMKIEGVDPLNLATISVATVMKVLRHGYIMIRMDGYETNPNGGDWFCYHGFSPVIFLPGFCERNSIKVKVPAGYKGDFSWVDYLRGTKSEAAAMLLFSHKEDCKHGLKVGMKVECTDLMDPKAPVRGHSLKVSSAGHSVTKHDSNSAANFFRVVNRLMKVHIDEWEDDFDPWMDLESVDIYPVSRDYLP